jgi:hypothetical protein
MMNEMNRSKIIQAARKSNEKTFFIGAKRMKVKLCDCIKNKLFL